MCKWGTYVEMPVQVWVNMPNYPMKLELKDRYIDACLAPLIYKLNQNQITTLNCCCGHTQKDMYNCGDSNIVEPSIIIDVSSARHADSMGYYVTISQGNFAEIKLEEGKE